MSRLDRLRSGDVVEYGKGKKGRLNLETKHFENSEGLSVYVGDDPDFFPKGEEQLKTSKERESLESSIANTPFGDLLFQFGNQGIANAAKNWVNKATQSPEDYERTKRISSQVSEKISEESPFTSLAATGLSFIPDIALTKGMSGATAAPLLTAAHAGPRLIEEPSQVSKEALVAAGGGYLIDKAFGGLSKIANRRKEIRTLPERQQSVRDFNAAGRQEVERLKHEAEIAKVRNKNEYAEKQREYLIAKENYENQVKSIENQNKLAIKKHEIELKNLPDAQARVQKQYSDNVIKNVEKMSESLPKNATFQPIQLGINDFIDQSLNKGVLAGSGEASRISKMLNSLFPENEVLNAKKLVDRYKTMENIIQKSSPEIQSVLSDFKSHLSEKLPKIITDTTAYYKVMPNLSKDLKDTFNSTLKSLKLPVSQKDYKMLQDNFNKNIDKLISEIGQIDFLKKLETGEIKELILKNVISPYDFLEGGLKHPHSIAFEKGFLKNLPTQHHYENFLKNFQPRLDNILSKAEQKVLTAEIDISKKIKNPLNQTLGTAQQISPPQPPTPMNAPNFNLQTPTQNPIPLPPEPFMSIPEPNLTPSQGVSDSLAGLLEKNPLGGRGLVNNPLTKLAGLKYVLGKGALPLEAAYMGMKGLTSPTQAGEIARMSFKTGGIQAIDQMAQKYVSYNNGVLNDPMERRSLTKEVENDIEIPIEQKAIIQSKINRGRPLDQPL